MFEKGDEIEIFGSPARTEPTTCYTETVTFSDGRTLIRYGEVDDNGEFINPEQDDAKTESKPQQSTAAATDMPSIAGDWGEPIADGPPLAYAGPSPDFVLTQAAIDVGDKWTSEDNPRFKCQPTNIILDYRFDQMVNKIEQTPTEINLLYGFMDLKRTIHIDGDFPDRIEPSITGFSVGQWNGTKLEVMTKGFAPGFLEVIGGRSTRSVHAWIGAILALLLILVAATGTVLIWKEAYVRFTFSQHAQALEHNADTLAGIVLSAESAFGAQSINRVRFGDSNLGISRLDLINKHAAYIAADGTVLEEWGPNGRLEDWVLDLHHRLLSGTTGLYVVGFAGIAALVMVLALVAYWPRRRLWRVGIVPRSVKRPQLLLSHRNSPRTK